MFGVNRRNVLVLGAAAFPPRLGSIAAVAKQNGWNLHIDRLSRCDDGISYDGAIVLLAWNKSEIRFARRLARRGVPLVDLAYINTQFPCPRVIGDNVEIGKMAAEHFSARGFKHAVWFASGWSAAHRLRFDGFKGAFAGEAAKWIRASGRGECRLRRKTSIYDWLGERLAAAPKPLAVATYDDADAVCVLAACLKRKIAVPEDVSICGVDDDTDLCENQEVPLSSVQHDQAGLASQGAKLLQRLMDGKSRPTKPIAVPPSGITIRFSTDTIAASDPRLRKALAFLRDNLDKPIGLVETADAIPASVSTVKRLFASGVSQGLPQTLLRLRLHQAKRLLADTDLKIADIARRCGFCNASYLTNTFRRAFGVTPLAWRHHTKCS